MFFTCSSTRYYFVKFLNAVIYFERSALGLNKVLDFGLGLLIITKLLKKLIKVVSTLEYVYFGTKIHILLYRNQIIYSIYREISFIVLAKLPELSK